MNDSEPQPWTLNVELLNAFLLPVQPGAVHVDGLSGDVLIFVGDEEGGAPPDALAGKRPDAVPVAAGHADIVAPLRQVDANSLGFHEEKPPPARARRTDRRA